MRDYIKPFIEEEEIEIEDVVAQSLNTEDEWFDGNGEGEDL